MDPNLISLNSEEIKGKIYLIRRQYVMLVSDLAELYSVDTKVLNQTVKRNHDRFPKEFMFQLTQKEFETIKSKFLTSPEQILRSQFVTLRWGKHKKYLPYVFTEQGVAMLSGVIRSAPAVKISIQIINAFVAMRKFLAKNAEIFGRLNHVERKQIIYDQKLEEIFDTIQSKDFKPDKGVFFEGQIFDAYKFVSDLIKTAKKSIILIDNYIDDSVLTLFTKRNNNVKVLILTKDISKQLSLDLKKYNLQYPLIEIQEFKQSQDRFMIIDEKEVYHFGASLKDLGKKWFAFSKFDKEATNMLEKISIS